MSAEFCPWIRRPNLEMFAAHESAAGSFLSAARFPANSPLGRWDSGRARLVPSSTGLLRLVEKGLGPEGST